MLKIQLLVIRVNFDLIAKKIRDNGGEKND